MDAGLLLCRSWMKGYRMKSKWKWRTGWGRTVVVEGLEGWLSLWPWQWLVGVKWHKILSVTGWMARRDSRVSQDAVRRGERGKGTCSMFSGQVGSYICGKTVLGRPEGCLYNYVDVCLFWKNAPFLNSNFLFFFPQGKLRLLSKTSAPSTVASTLWLSATTCAVK